MNAKDRAIIESIRQQKGFFYGHFYLNVVQFMNGKWGVVFRNEFIGAVKRSEAVDMRRRFYEHIHGANPKHWKPRRFRTIKII